MQLVEHHQFMLSARSGVALDVVRLAAPVVSMHPRPALLDPVVCAGLLIDLALSGSLITSPDGLEIDTDPTGFFSADKLLAGVVKHPDKPLAWWLYHAPVTVNDLADELVTAGAWERHGHGPLRRYRPVHPEQRAHDLKRLGEAPRHPDSGGAADATALLLSLLPLTDLPARVRYARLAKRHTGADWLLPDLLDNLQRQRAILNAAGVDARQATALTYLA